MSFCVQLTYSLFSYNVTFLDECEAPVARRVQWQPNPLKLWPAFEFLSQICRVFQGNCRCHLPSLGIILAIFFILCDLSSSRLSILSANTSVIPKIHFPNQICEDSAPNSLVSNHQNLACKHESCWDNGDILEHKFDDSWTLKRA